MKRLLLLLSILSLNAQLFAQIDFCVPGARWMYESSGTGQSGPGQSTYIYVGDTLINGFSDVKILKEEFRGFYPWGGSMIYYEGRSYLWQGGDSIFQYVDGNFELAFDLGVEVGDTRVVYFSADLCFNLDTMLIENIDTINYQGEFLRRYHYKLLVDDQLSQIEGPGSAGVSESTYVERIGFMVDHPVLNGFRCEGNLISEYDARNFLCYTDNELAATYPDTCNLFLGTAVVEVTETELIMYQNQILVQNASNSALHIYNILGKELLQERITSNNHSVDVGYLPDGILMIVVEAETGQFSKKVVKTNFN